MPSSGAPVVEGRPKSGRIKARKGNADEAPFPDSEKAAPSNEAHSASVPDSSNVSEKTDAAREGGGGSLEASSHAGSNGHGPAGEVSDQPAEPPRREPEAVAAAKGGLATPATDATDTTPEVQSPPPLCARILASPVSGTSVQAVFDPPCVELLAGCPQAMSGRCFPPPVCMSREHACGLGKGGGKGAILILGGS